jgi:glycosyltransferase involved in cell wall biosynthesis
VRPDLIHLNGYVHGALPWSAPKVMVGHSCVLSWWQAVKGEPAPPEWEPYARAVAAGLAAADLVIAPSEAMLASLATHYGKLPRTRVIFNGRDCRDFKPSPKEPIVFSAGRLWDEAKNLEALERVAPNLPWDVFVAGESIHPDGGEIRPHHTRLLGHLSQRALSAWLGRASIYCLPARYEPFGLSALEAALSGCALVLGDIPSLREIWRHRAVFVPPNDPEALESALKTLIDNPDRRASLTAGARARALQLTPEKMLDGYLAAYCDVLAAREASLLDDSASFPAQVAV